MEGVFGDYKNHYGLRKIRGKGEKKKKVMVFLATMTANTVKIAMRKEKKISPLLSDRAARLNRKHMEMPFKGRVCPHPKKATPRIRKLDELYFFHVKWTYDAPTKPGKKENKGQNNLLINKVKQFSRKP
nr:hypothetical protein [Pleomorphovibrio marinus]